MQDAHAQLLIWSRRSAWAPWRCLSASPGPTPLGTLGALELLSAELASLSWRHPSFACAQSCPRPCSGQRRGGRARAHVSSSSCCISLRLGGARHGRKFKRLHTVVHKRDDGSLITVEAEGTHRLGRQGQQQCAVVTALVDSVGALKEQVVLVIHVNIAPCTDTGGAHVQGTALGSLCSRWLAVRSGPAGSA